MCSDCWCHLLGWCMWTIPIIFTYISHHSLKTKITCTLRERLRHPICTVLGVAIIYTAELINLRLREREWSMIYHLDYVPLSCQELCHLFIYSLLLIHCVIRLKWRSITTELKIYIWICSCMVNFEEVQNSTKKCSVGCLAVPKLV